MSIITGTYTGNGSSSQNIALGFKPKAVLVNKTDGSFSRSEVIDIQVGTSWTTRVRDFKCGGLAVEGSNCDTVAINDTGFVVFFEATPASSERSNTVSKKTNEKGSVYNYIVFK